MRVQRLSLSSPFPGCLAVALVAAAAACDSPLGPAEAGPNPRAPVLAAAQGSEANVVVFATGDAVGTSSLVRNKNGVSMTYRSSGLEPGTVATIWWVVFNDPDECEGGTVAGVALTCTAADIPDPAVDASVFYAAGHVIGGPGRANYAARLPVGRLTVDPDPDANQLIAGDGILKDAGDAVVHLVLRTHGPAIPGMINHMVSTFDAGCTTAPVDLQGPNTCMNLQFAAHE